MSSATVLEKRNIINSVSTDIDFKTAKKYTLEIMQNLYDQGFNPKYLIVNKADIKMVKNIFKEFKRGDLGKYFYETDFGLLNILQNKDMNPGEVMVTDKY